MPFICPSCLRALTEERHRAGVAEREQETREVEALKARYERALRSGRAAKGGVLAPMSGERGYGPLYPDKPYLDPMGEPCNVHELDFDPKFRRIGRRLGLQEDGLPGATGEKARTATQRYKTPRQVVRSRP